MKIKELRRLLNAIPASLDDEDLTVVDPSTREDFELVTLGVDIDGTPVMQIELN